MLKELDQLPFKLDPPVWGDMFISEATPDRQWIVPGLLERGDRVIVTGNEGEGKSTWLRQLALQISNGIHPFTLQPMERQRVMLLDLENSREQIKNELVKISIRAGVPVPGEPWLAVWSLPAGVNLAHESYEMNIQAGINQLQPDIIVGGPMYKMIESSLSDETASRLLSAALDRLRMSNQHNQHVAMIWEAHQINEQTAFDPSKKEWRHNRALRPFGSTLWRRWPEFGICLFKDGTLAHWRGQRQERQWIKKLQRDGETWLWQPDNGLCPVCGDEMSKGKEKYCSNRCRETAKKRRQRGQVKLLPDQD